VEGGVILCSSSHSLIRYAVGGKVAPDHLANPLRLGIIIGKRPLAEVERLIESRGICVIPPTDKQTREQRPGDDADMEFFQVV
jgi:hypothetical protein